MSLKSELQVANALITNLAMLDGAGYEMMGFYSQTFLNDVTTRGAITEPNLQGYLADFENSIYAVEWLDTKKKARAVRFANTVRNFADARTEENLEVVVAF